MKITAEEIVVRYRGAERPALDRVSITVEPGQLCAVLGPNGSGKSTLMRALLGVTRISAGRALVGDRPVGAWERVALARAVGAVGQSESIAFPLSVRELVAMGRYPHMGRLSAEGPADRAAIERALDACDLEQLAHRDVQTLSGGELQRARIARALAQEPSALLLDEPTTSLDIRHQMGILELIRHAADDGKSVLLVTHDLDLAARFADRMVLLSEGRVAAEGGVDAVMSETTLSRVYAWPITVAREPGAPPRIHPRRSDRSTDGVAESQRAAASTASSLKIP